MDFFQTYVIELKDREESPLYCVEHLIDGNYIKYNSNSGFVSEVNRLTPQAFSHFTFERSNHRLIVVDIQGRWCHVVMCDVMLWSCDACTAHVMPLVYSYGVIALVM